MKKFLALIVVALFGVTIANAYAYTDIGGVATDVDVNYHSVIEVNGNPNVLVPVKSTNGTEFFVKVEKAKYDKAVNAIAESLTESIEKSVVQINQYKALADEDYEDCKHGEDCKHLILDEEVESEPGGIYNPRPEEAWHFSSFLPILGSLINQYTSKGYELGEAVELVMGDLGEVVPRLGTGISAFISHAISELTQIVVNERLRISLEPIAGLAHTIDDAKILVPLPALSTLASVLIDFTLVGFIPMISDTLYHPGEEPFDIHSIPVLGSLAAYPENVVDAIEWWEDTAGLMVMPPIQAIEWLQDTAELPFKLLIQGVGDIGDVGEGDSLIPGMDLISEVVDQIDGIITDSSTQGYIDILDRLEEEGYISAGAVNIEAIPADMMGDILDMMMGATGTGATLIGDVAGGLGSAVGGVAGGLGSVLGSDSPIAERLYDFILRGTMSNFTSSGVDNELTDETMKAANSLANATTDMVATATPRLADIYNNLFDNLLNMFENSTVVGVE